MQNIAIFASYNGTALDSISKAINNGELNLNISLIISNNSNAKVLEKAKKLDIPSFVINDSLFDDVNNEIFNILNDYDCKYIFLAGYMKKISENLANEFTIINSHPALLPKYGGKGMYGRKVHEAIIENNEKESGVTVHMVNENYDEGTIILQNTLNLDNNETVDSLENKIKSLEQSTIIEALQICLK